MRRLPPHGHSRQGATLVEVLVALGIGALVISVIVLAHHTLTSETSRLSRAHKIKAQQEEVLFALREDLHQLFFPEGDLDCAVELENSATNLVRLAFCRWQPGIAKGALTTNPLERITYRLSEDTPQELLVVRRALNGPAALSGETTNRLAGGWPRVLIHLHDGEQWKTNWVPAAPDDPDPPRPRAARIQLLGEAPSPGRPGDVVSETVVVIPSGLSVTSTILRANAPSP